MDDACLACADGRKCAVCRCTLQPAPCGHRLLKPGRRGHSSWRSWRACSGRFQCDLRTYSRPRMSATMPDPLYIASAEISCYFIRSTRSAPFTVLYRVAILPARAVFSLKATPLQIPPPPVSPSRMRHLHFPNLRPRKGRTVQAPCIPFRRSQRPVHQARPHGTVLPIARGSASPVTVTL